MSGFQIIFNLVTRFTNFHSVYKQLFFKLTGFYSLTKFILKIKAKIHIQCFFSPAVKPKSRSDVGLIILSPTFRRKYQQIWLFDDKQKENNETFSSTCKTKIRGSSCWTRALKFGCNGLRNGINISINKHVQVHYLHKYMNDKIIITLIGFKYDKLHQHNWKLILKK